MNPIGTVGAPKRTIYPYGTIGGVKRLFVECLSTIAIVGTQNRRHVIRRGFQQPKVIANVSPQFDRDLRSHDPVDKPHVVAGGATDTGGARLESAEAPRPTQNPLSGSAAKSAEVAKARLSRAIARD